ncbi:hypothetical protein [Micromonospora musae]|uniref:hypothetical protein n=1 Tax=Micromonospora musae TaxID=1894970 RepID=UPI0033D944F2
MKLDVTRLPGQAWGLAAAGSTGPIYLTSYAGRSPTVRDLDTTVLSAVDLNGATIWQRTFTGHPFPPRIDGDGTVWVVHQDGADPPVFTLTCVGADGATLRSVTPQQEPSEHLGAVVRAPDGFYVLWLPTGRRYVLPDGATARLARHDDAGDTVWSTPLPLERVSFGGVVEASMTTGWQVRPKRTWKPSTLEVSHWEPLLVAGDRVLAGITDGSSGIGVCFIVDTESGDIVATTEPGPYHHKAIAGPGRFLVGAQGYGALTSTLYDHDGRVAQTWPSHGQMLVDERGTIRGPESENTMPSRSRFRVLNRDGSMRDGPPLTGYHTTYPALDDDGTTVFWRDGQLLAVDEELRRRELLRRDDDRAVLSRVLLLDEGIVAFSVADELLIVRGTGLAPLAAGPWPCADGGIHGNPVVSVG